MDGRPLGAADAMGRILRVAAARPHAARAKPA